MNAHGRIRLLLLLLALPLAVVGFLQAGHWLIDDDTVEQADVAVVLSGDPVRRSLAARDLYKQGRVRRILVIPEPGDPIEKELEALGLRHPGQPQWSEQVLLASGVPKSQVAFLPQPVDGVINEAVQVRQFLKDGTAGEDSLPRSLAVITSKFASRRSCWAFERIFASDSVQINCHPTPYDGFQAERWWAKPRNALMVTMEYQKLVVNAVSLLLNRHAAR